MEVIYRSVLKEPTPFHLADSGRNGKHEGCLDQSREEGEERVQSNAEGPVGQAFLVEMGEYDDDNCVKEPNELATGPRMLWL